MLIRIYDIEGNKRKLNFINLPAHQLTVVALMPWELMFPVLGLTTFHAECCRMYTGAQLVSQHVSSYVDLEYHKIS